MVFLELPVVELVRALEPNLLLGELFCLNESAYPMRQLALLLVDLVELREDGFIKDLFLNACIRTADDFLEVALQIYWLLLLHCM